MLLACIIACFPDAYAEDRVVCIVEYKRDCGEQYQCTPSKDLIYRDWQVKLGWMEYHHDRTPPPAAPIYSPRKM